MKDFATQLIDWHQQFGRRGLPWQSQTDPYKVWLSEIMLQQTQVATVIDRYQLFLATFPTIYTLANASLEEVMALWAGLGYYSRARNLHACAQKIVTSYGGEFPRQVEELNNLPGIGKSTARAIAAFCFHHQKSILDANVQRVLARIHGIREPLKSAVELKKLWDLADQLVPVIPSQMPIYTQALMDFGATVCKPNTPKCQSDSISTCIYKNDCWAYQHGQVDQIPLKIKKKPSKIVVSEMLMMIDQDEILLARRENSGIWGGLWTLPETPWIEIDDEKKISSISFQANQYAPIVVLNHGINYQNTPSLAPIKHVFSHRNLYFLVKILAVQKLDLSWAESCRWVKISELPSIGLPTPIRKLFEDYDLLNRVQ